MKNNTEELNLSNDAPVEDAELTDEQLENVAGGTAPSDDDDTIADYSNLHFHRSSRRRIVTRD